MLEFFKTPPIVYIVIETDGKTQEELEAEIKQQVENEMASQLSIIDRKDITDSEYNKIASLLENEKDKMLKHFIGQLKMI